MRTTTRPAPADTALAPACPYLTVVVSAPALRLLAPRDIDLLLELAAGPRVIEVEGYEAPAPEAA